jgi:hypothetical protein
MVEIGDPLTAILIFLPHRVENGGRQKMVDGARPSCSPDRRGRSGPNGSEERAMGLVHKHLKIDEKNPKLPPKVILPTITRPFARVGSGLVAISKAGKTPLWSEGFNGCVGVVMCGAGPWGAMAHLNQRIQATGRSLALALSTLSEFVSGQMKDNVREVLLFYGDPPGSPEGDNLGKVQGSKLTEAKIKELMKCQKVIDLRRKDRTQPYGTDFVYDPSLQLVYTSDKKFETGDLVQAGRLMGLMDNDKDVTPPQNKRSNFPFRDASTEELLGGLATKGWYFVP